MMITHTYVTMELSRPTFEEIESKLRKADYLHAISMDGDRVAGLIMQGIMLTCADDEQKDAAQLSNREMPVAEAREEIPGHSVGVVALPELNDAERAAENMGVGRENLGSSACSRIIVP